MTRTRIMIFVTASAIVLSAQAAKAVPLNALKESADIGNIMHWVHQGCHQSCEIGLVVYDSTGMPLIIEHTHQNRWCQATWRGCSGFKVRREWRRLKLPEPK
jgi:hypothetical protein